MTLEQKAKAYDKALEWMRKVYPTLTGADKEDAEYYFAELKESEDERIRQGIVETIKQCADILDPKNQKRMLDWLENQKEQKPAEWSEEDEEHLKSIISTIECSKAQFPNSPTVVTAYNSDLSWLKSLRPQKQKERNMDEWLEDGKRCYEKGKADVLNDLPKWKKVETNAFYPDITYSNKGKCPMLHYGEYEINIVKLKEALPKEEE